LEICVTEIGANTIGVGEHCLYAIGIGEVRASAISTSEVGTATFRITKIYAHQISFIEVSLGAIRV